MHVMRQVRALASLKSYIAGQSSWYVYKLVGSYLQTRILSCLYCTAHVVKRSVVFIRVKIRVPSQTLLLLK